MSDESWKIDNTGWKDAKDSPNDPDWWYSILFGPFRRQYRKKSPEQIQRITREKGEQWVAREKGEQWVARDMAYQLLVPFSGADARCAKCGHTGAKARHRTCTGGDTWGTSLYNPDTQYLVRICRCCKYQWNEKPLDWENPL